MTVKLRKKEGKKISLYLDFYSKGKRQREFLKLYLHTKPKSKAEKDLNKKTLQLAETICAQRQIEIQNGTFGFRNNEKLKASFITYLKMLANKRKDSIGNYYNWDSVIKHVERFAPNGVTFEDVNRGFVESFKNYLENAKKLNSNQPLAQNSKYSYFNKVRAALKQAVRDGILAFNPSVNVKPFKQGETQREFLTQEELIAVGKTECDNLLLKTAFLFSCLTGLRWSDLNKMVWSEVQHSNEMGNYIRFRQKKTSGLETHPIGLEAIDLIAPRQGNQERVFKGLKYSAWHNVKLQQWMMRAGISRTITFHSGRHTYAVLQLLAGTDIYTLSKLLGHKSLKTTEVYAKIVDAMKIEAANRITLI